MLYNIAKSDIKDQLLKAKELFNQDVKIEVEFKVLIGNETRKHH